MKKILLSFAMLLIGVGAMAQNAVEFTFRRNGENATVNISGAEGIEATIVATSPSPQSNATKVGVWNVGGAMATDTHVLCPSTNTSATNAENVITFTLTITGLSEDFACSDITLTNVPVNAGGNYQSGSYGEDRNCNFILNVNDENVSTIDNEYIGYTNGNVANTTSFNNLKLYADNGTMTVKITLYQSRSVGSFYGLTKIVLTQPIALNVTDAGYATLYANTNLEIPTDVEAYVVSEVNSDFATLTQVTGILPANEGIIIKASKGKYDFFQTTEDATSTIETNYLEGSAVDFYVAGDAYVLANGTDGIGLYKATLNKNENGGDGNTHFLNNAGKAYLPISAFNNPAGVRFISFDFGNETAIESVEAENEEVKTEIYDLAGRRVQNAQKGVFIVNGKVVIK